MIGRMYLTWNVLDTSNHGWLECTPHAIDVEHDLRFADVDCSDNLVECLPGMSGDEVDLLSILEVEFLLEIPTQFGLRF
jgi:hypothetical protein